MPAGSGRVYLYAYRRAGDQWERHSIATVRLRAKRRGNSIPEQVYYKGRRIGSIRIDPDSGKLAAAGDPDAIFETFRVGTAPERERRGAIRKVAPVDNPVTGTAGASADVTEKLF